MLEQFLEKLLDNNARCKQKCNIYSHRFPKEISFKRGRVRFD
jgi:hypothetical protein